MKKYKWVYLFFAILLPILLTFFLKYFGKSEFNIPVYYEAGIKPDTLSATCRYQYAAPYKIADSVIRNLSSKNASKAIIITIDSTTETKKNFERIDEELVSREYDFVVLKNDSSFDRLKSCIFFLEKPWTTMLIDNQNRIRGYYAPATREETDRLIVELKILLKKY